MHTNIQTLWFARESGVGCDYEYGNEVWMADMYMQIAQLGATIAVNKER